MPSPQVKQGDADAHRQPDEEPDTTTDGGEVAVETTHDEAPEAATTGGDPDPDDGDPNGDPDSEQAHGGDDDGGGPSLFTNKRVVAAIILLALIGLALAARQQGGGMGNANSGSEQSAPDRMTADRPEDIDDALEQANAPPERGVHVPKDRNDPLAADGYVLKNTSIFPSISGDDS